MNDVIIVSLIGIGSMLVGKIIWDWLSRRNGNGNGSIDKDMKKVVYEIRECLTNHASDSKEFKPLFEKMNEHLSKIEWLLSSYQIKK